MRPFRILPLTGALVALALTAPALSAQNQAPPLSQYRTQLMTSMQAHVGALRLLGSGDVVRNEDVARHARAVRDISEMLLELWPEGSGGEGTRALPAIWENWDDFRGKLEALRDAGVALQTAADAGSTDGVAQAMQGLGQGCRSCHGDYRARAN